MLMKPAYADQGQLFFSWTCKTVDSGQYVDEASFAAMALRPKGLAIIAYAEQDNDDPTTDSTRLKMAVQWLRHFLPLIKN